MTIIYSIAYVGYVHKKNIKILQNQMFILFYHINSRIMIFKCLKNFQSSYINKNQCTMTCICNNSSIIPKIISKMFF